MNLLEKIKTTKINDRHETIPPGWKTVYMVRKEESPHLSESRVRSLLADGVKLGVVEVKRCRVAHKGGTAFLNCYREKTSEKKTR